MTRFLASLGFSVESVDISQVALENLSHLPNITPICADLDDFTIHQKYDVILNSFFLDRRLFTSIINALNPNGLVLFETFIDIILAPHNTIKPCIWESWNKFLAHTITLKLCIFTSTKIQGQNLLIHTSHSSLRNISHP